MFKNNTSPLVSVIVPIYKVEKYLCECVDSIISQTYTNLEIILVDDGSPDKCPEICDEYVKQDNRVKVIHKQNGGLSDARNVGIEIAQGEYLSFVDSDDVIHHEMIEVLMQPLLENKEMKMAACQCLCFTDGDEIDAIQKIMPIEIIDYCSFFNKRLWVTSWGKVYRSELFNGIKFPVGRIHEDEFTTYKICYEAKKVAYTESQLLFYRLRKGSITERMSAKRVVDEYAALKGQVDFFQMKHEYVLYVKFLFYFAKRYFYFMNIKKDIEGIDVFLKQCKKELKNYSRKSFTTKQKINFFLFVNFPRTRCWMGKIKRIMFSLLKCRFV